MPDIPNESEPQPETTAVVPTTTEQDVIEGEVIILDQPEPPEDHTPPKQKPYWLLIVFTLFLCLFFLVGSLVLPILTPSATVTLIPVERTITTTAAIQVPGRALPPLTLMQSTSVASTGKGHQDATKAQGTITFYNGSFSSQTIAAGTILTGRDAVAIMTDQTAVIPAGNPPIYGQITVAAHAVVAGAQGNIPANDINTACCGTSILAKNTESFTGGAAAREYSVVTREDIQNAASPLKATLSQSDHAALQAQLHPGEELITPSCSPHVSSDHKPGDEATNATVTVSETCSGIAYTAPTLYANATQLLTSQATTKLGANYSLIGDIQVTILQASAINPHQGLVNALVSVNGTWAYQITPGMQQHLIKLIAGKTKEQAIRSLLAVSGIQGVYMTLAGGQNALPQDVRNIHLTILYRGV